MTEKIYPDSGVELNEFVAKNYDKIMNTMSFGLYRSFIHKAIKQMDVQPGSSILDLGCGTGRNAALMAKYIGDSGHITGLDISELMEKQFLKKFNGQSNIRFNKQRIDQPFDLKEQFDIVFISFVIHGFPNEIRSTVIQNAFTHLKPGGIFYILDFAEFDMAKMPELHRFIFKKIECKYAFDYIERDWKANLKEAGFDNFDEHFYLKKYVRLLKAVITEKTETQIKSKYMKVAIPSDNQETITKRTGQSKGFMVYEIKSGEITHSEYRVNTMDEHDEQAEHSHAEIIELLKDVDILLVAAIGKHMKRDVDNSPLKYQMVREEKLTQIIDNFLKRL